jgi:diguanylate cyclase (GGDEF)-like protein
MIKGRLRESYYMSKKTPINFLDSLGILKQRTVAEQLSHMAYHDSLTGLANRNGFEQFISQVLSSARQHNQEFALLFLDLDRFKNVNDTIGHEAGDLILQIIAERLRSAIRDIDMVARLGGDEFVLLITDMHKTESVAAIAQKILENILKVIVIQGQEIYLTTSIGISLYPQNGQTMQILMKNADLALYRAKEYGRNNYQFYTIEMTIRAQEKMMLQNALGHALVKDEFILHYQPMMNIETQKIIGLEALLRWKNKEYSSIPPSEIITLAEETGLIIPVSEWVLKTACQQLRHWRTAGFPALTMAVNCSARQFKQQNFADDILKIIMEAKIPASALEIEITESTIMQDPENTLRILYALKDLGVKIVIDDFGTGYWSLSNLKKLSVDKIKIDKTFIRQITIDEMSATITSAIIAMVNKLGIISIAEGVETQGQYEFLAREGCVDIQGYYLTPPLAQNAMTCFLKHPVSAGKVDSNKNKEIIT